MSINVTQIWIQNVECLWYSLSIWCAYVCHICRCVENDICAWETVAWKKCCTHRQWRTIAWAATGLIQTSPPPRKTNMLTKHLQSHSSLNYLVYRYIIFKHALLNYILLIIKPTNRWLIEDVRVGFFNNHS